MNAGDPGLMLLGGAVVVLWAVVAARTTHRIGLPGLLVFLGRGLGVGDAGLGVRVGNGQVAQALGTSALVLVLGEGGLTANLAHVRAAAPAALTLATVGVAVSIVVIAAVSHWLLLFGWRNALLLGAVLAPTDSAAVFSGLRQLPLPPRLSGMLEAAAGFNDAPSVLAVLLLDGAALHLPAPPLTAGLVAYE